MVGATMKAGHQSHLETLSEKPLDASRLLFDFGESRQKWSYGMEGWCLPDNIAPSNAIMPEGIAYGGACMPCQPAWNSEDEGPEFGSDQLEQPHIFEDLLADDSRQTTPVFIPGLQDHYTGLVQQRLLSSLKCMDAEAPVAIDPAPALKESSAEQVPTEKNFKDTRAVNGKKSAGPKAVPAAMQAGKHDVKKLESLIWLYLNTSEGDEAVGAPEVGASYGKVHMDEVVAPVSAKAPAQHQKESPPPPPILISTECSADCPAPAVPAGNVIFSCGSVGHPESCKEPCKYARKKRGCKDGLACSRCHLCTWYHKRNAASKLSTVGLDEQDIADEC
jgi:hypothetical protein